MGCSLKRSHLAGLLACMLPATVAAGAGPAKSAKPVKGTTAPAVVLANRYIDPLNGFSLRPPAGARRKREFSPTRLVTWLHRDGRTGAVDLTLAVLRRETKVAIDPADYARKLANTLKKEEQFATDSVKTVQVAGKPAIDLRGRAARLGLWQRQVWIRAEPKRFLIVAVSGPAGKSSWLDGCCEAVLETLRLTDPTAARKARKENLRRGQSLLDSLTDAKLAKLIDERPRWFLVHWQGKCVGYMGMRLSAARELEAPGYAVRSVSRVALPKQPVRRMRRTYFATPDRRLSKWTESLRVRAGARSVRTLAEGIKQGDAIVCTLSASRGGAPRDLERRLPGPIEACYLPKALGMMLGRLVDRGEPRAYAFATYTAVHNAFDVRTFTIVGKRTIALSGRKVDAVHATDQTAEDAEPVRIWLDDDGRLLRMESVGALRMDVATEAAVSRRFADDAAEIKRFGQ